MKKQISLFGALLMVATTLIAGANKPLSARIIDNRNARKSIEIISNEFEPTLNDGISKNSITHREYGLKKTKSSGVFKQRLDSTVAPYNYKEISKYNAAGREEKYNSYNWSIIDEKWVAEIQQEYTYDEYGLNNVYIESKWDSNNGRFVVVTRKEITYNKLGNYTSSLDYRLNTTTNEIEGVWRDDITYDQTGSNVLTQDFFVWNTTQKSWDISENIVIEYNANGDRKLGIINDLDTISGLFRPFVEVHYEFDRNHNLILSTEYDWNHLSGNMELAYKTEFVYSNLNQLLLITYAEYVNNDWQFTGRYTFTYHTDGRPKSVLNEKWDQITHAFIGKYKQENGFNAKDQFISFSEWEWSVPEKMWIPSRLKNITYQASGIRETYLDSGWDSISNKWQGQISITQKNDDNGNLMKLVALNWDNAKNVWYGKVNIEFEHNLNYTSDQLLTFMNREEHPNMVLSLVNNKWANNEWVFNNKADYFYSEQELTGVKNAKDMNFKLFPNPAKNSITVAADGVNGVFELFNTQGSIVLSNNLSSGNQINIKDLNKGIYVYKVTINGLSKTGKLIKN